MKARTFFLDSSFIYALLNRNDQYHRQAVAVTRNFTRNDRFVLTDAIILEACSLLSSLRARASIISFLESIAGSEYYTTLHTGEDLFHQAYGYFVQHDDKEWSLVDCISFIVMRERNIPLALTADHHFDQAGFTAVLLHPELI
jgi:predicted nucleic acid-binding protein